MPNVLRNLPSVSELLESPPLKSLIERLNPSTVVSGVRHFLDDMQAQVRTAAAGVQVPAPAELAMRIAEWLGADRRPSVLPVINATGNILHPRVGGAPVADEALSELAALTHGYASFEYDLATGSESVATAAVERLLTKLTGAEAAAVAGSQSGALLVTLAALAAGREIVVARGQVTTIDGGYRLPDLFAGSGAVLREAGTANIAHSEDYASVTSERTAGYLRIQAPTYAMVGESSAASMAEILALARGRNLTTIEFLDSASIVDLTANGIAGVPVVSESVKGGVDLTIFRGDGFVGGPPCGVIVGRRDLIEKIVAHPLMRAIRAEKLSLAALGGTLRLYEDAQVAERAVPVLSLIATPLENLRQRAERIGPQMAATGVVTVEEIACQSYVAGHEVPGQALPTIVLALTPKQGTAEQLAAALRLGTPAVVSRLSEGRVLLDLRSVLPREDISLVAAVAAQQIERG
jgi:L-seryl-tRNA(Ser) seleniumtransferase